MSELRQLQRQFQAYVRAGRREVVPAVAGDQRAGPEERLNVYYQAYRLRALEVLRNDFPGLHGLMGETRLRELCVAYLKAHPPSQPSIRWLGEELATFLDGAPGYAAEPELAEMARFEWAKGLAFDAADRDVVNAVMIEQLQPEEWPLLTFRLHPSLQTVQLRCNVSAIYRAVVDGGPMPPVACSDDALTWLIWRKTQSVSWRSLGEPETAALECVLDGGSFSVLCDVLCSFHREEEVPAQAAAMLKRWLTDGLVSSYSIRPGD